MNHVEHSALVLSLDPAYPVQTRRVRSKWVPGTNDRLELKLLESDERVEVCANWFRQQAGREAMDALYLKGKLEFDCCGGFWQIASNQAVHQRNT
jgi:hypothetical protein